MPLVQKTKTPFCSKSAQCPYVQFVQDRMMWCGLSCCVFLLSLCSLSANAGMEDSDWGSGLHELLSSFPADAPFLRETPGRPANCTQRFWLPPSSPVCWDEIAGPEEFEKSRLLVLQNRAALEAVYTSSGLQDGGASYDQQAREEVQGLRDEHLAVIQTTDTMQKVFLDLDEKRKEGKEHYTFNSLKEQTENTRGSIANREQAAALLEKHLLSLERFLNTVQLRLDELFSQ